MENNENDQYHPLSEAGSKLWGLRRQYRLNELMISYLKTLHSSATMVYREVRRSGQNAKFAANLITSLRICTEQIQELDGIQSSLELEIGQLSGQLRLPKIDGDDKI